MKVLGLRITMIITCWATVFIAPTLYTMEIIKKRVHEDVLIIEDIIAPDLEQRLHGEQPAIANNPYKDTVAYVEHNEGISEGERLSNKNRTPIVEAALEKFLGRSLKGKKLPMIASSFSGGGDRATCWAAGCLLALEELGLLDCFMYLIGLSGSTWMLGPWLASGKSLTEYVEYMQDRISRPFIETSHEEKLLIADAIAVKKIYHQPRTLVDPYSDLLGNEHLAFAGEKRHMIYLSDLAQKVELGQYPYLVFTAIDGSEKVVTDPTWYTITPHTISDYETNMHVPTWAFGRKFKNGKSIDYAPEKPLDYWMGTCGSAFAADIKTIAKHDGIKNKTIKEDIEHLLKPIEGKRPLPWWAEIQNPLYKMTIENNKKLTTKKHRKIVDAGLSSMNNPFVPASGICPERKADIAFLFDASAGEYEHQLSKIADFTKKHNLPFPIIDESKLTQTYSCFKDEKNKNVPVINYFPRISDPVLLEKNKNNPAIAPYYQQLKGFNLDTETNKGFAETKEFRYTKEHSALIINQARVNILMHKDEIKQTINDWIDSH